MSITTFILGLPPRRAGLFAGFAFWSARVTPPVSFVTTDMTTARSRGVVPIHGVSIHGYLAQLDVARVRVSREVGGARTRHIDVVHALRMRACISLGPEFEAVAFAGTAHAVAQLGGVGRARAHAAQRIDHRRLADARAADEADTQAGLLLDRARARAQQRTRVWPQYALGTYALINAAVDRIVVAPVELVKPRG